MKKVLVFCVAVMFLLVCGCAGFNSNTAVTAASEVGLALVLKNNPQYKAPTLVALNGVKTVLSGSITYDQLIAEIAKYSGSEYSYIVAILMSNLSTDTPISKTYIPLLDKYKADLLKRIDKYIMISSI